MYTQNFNLKNYNTFGINVFAAQFAQANNLNTLQQIVADNKNQNNKLLILGGGSNILFTQNYNGLVIKNNLLGINIVQQDADFVYLQAHAGEPWHNFVMYCVSHAYGGLENLALIPGSVGAAPMQNIGAYGTEIKDTFYQLTALEISTNTLHTFSNTDCQFGYRQSIFKQQLKNKFIVTSVTFKLTKHNHNYNTSYGAIYTELQQLKSTTPNLQNIAQAVINIRNSKLPNPAQIGNAGSFFKNPTVPNSIYQQLQTQFSGIVGYAQNNNQTKIAAGWLIEQCGFKGAQKGNAGCHAKQALVLVNLGGATGAEIVQLSNNIIHAVQQKFGITLEPEVNII
jgi:UDP-N-acetylmuramate dehydrogenase